MSEMVEIRWHGRGGQGAVSQVCWEVNQQEQFERLGRLEVKAAAAQPQVRTVSERVGAKYEGDGSEQDAGGEPDIFVAAQKIQVCGQAQPRRHMPPGAWKMQPGRSKSGKTSYS